MSSDTTDRLDRLGLDAADGLRVARQGTTDLQAARAALDKTVRRRRAARVVVLAVVLAVLAVSVVHSRADRVVPSHPPVRLSGNGAIVLATMRGVVAVNPATGAATPVPGLTNKSPLSGDEWQPVAFSPDGHRLLVQDGDRVGVLDVGPGRITLVVGATSGTSMAWSPDGSRLATIASDGTLRIDTVGHSSTPETDLRVTATRTVATQVRGAVNTPMSWSPDGTRIAFIGLREDERWTSDLYVVSADGTGLHRLRATTPGNVGEQHGPASAAWSPDGTQLAFLEFFGSGPAMLQLIRPDGTGRRHVASIAFPGGEPCDCDKFNPPPVAWAPDGSAIAFQSEDVPEPYLYGLFIASLDGTVRHVFSQREQIPGLVWQPIPRPGQPRPTG